MSTLYLDMDGVVADFDKYAFKKLGVPPSGGVYEPDVWAKLVENPRLYRDLEKMTYADELVKQCKNFARIENHKLLFLTAVPKNNDVHWAFYDKVMWALARYPDIPVHFGPYGKDKHVHCIPGDILIDDKESNISDWVAAGGLGILHKNLKSTLDELESFKTNR